MRAARWRVLVGLVIVALSLSSMEVVVHAEEQRPPQPEDFWVTEFWGGEIGAILGGVIGFYIEENYWDWDQLYRWLYGRENPCRGYFKRGVLFCPYDRGQLLPFHFGRALGASTGVVLTGLQAGVDGNILGAYLATGLWFAASSYLILIESPMEEFHVLWIMPYVPAFLATVGYNIGAKMRSDRTKSAALG